MNNAALEVGEEGYRSTFPRPLAFPVQESVEEEHSFSGTGQRKEVGLPHDIVHLISLPSHGRIIFNSLRPSIIACK